MFNRTLQRTTVWLVSLVAVGLVQVALDLVGLPAPGWLPFAGVWLILAAAAASLVATSLRPLFWYFVVLLIMQPAIHPTLWPAEVRSWQVELPAGSSVLGGELAREAIVALVVVTVVLVAGYRGHRSFVAVGKLDAPAKPVRWLFDRPISWLRLGPISGLAIGLGTLAFVVMGGTVPDPARVAAVLPGVLVISGLNAINEEVVFRVGPLATLRDVLGERGTVALVVALFAIPHYYGVPFGLLGVAMAGVFAWWVTKSLLETGGVFWAWVIHAIQDVVIFSFIVSGAIG
jgi:hypothetical protein